MAKRNEETTRKQRGAAKDQVVFPLADTKLEMPESYPGFINEIKERVVRTRLETVVAANSAMILMYREIGNAILQRQKNEGWGTKVIDRMSYDLNKAVPDMQGFSPRNLKYMRKFAEAWPDIAIVQRTVALIPWRSNITLLDKLTEPELRLWYAQKTIENGFGKDMLVFQIESQLHKRQGAALQNFVAALPPHQSDMANQIFKDPYVFDFLGSQVHLELGGEDFYLDLLFYHLKLRCYVVVELKAGKFDAGYVSKLNMYLNVVNDTLRHPDDKPSIGLLLVKNKNKLVVEYALNGYTNPIGVANWESEIMKSLPEKIKASLPSIEEIENELKDEWKVKSEKWKVKNEK